MINADGFFPIKKFLWKFCVRSKKKCRRTGNALRRLKVAFVPMQKMLLLVWELIIDLEFDMRSAVALRRGHNSSAKTRNAPEYLNRYLH